MKRSQHLTAQRNPWRAFALVIAFIGIIAVGSVTHVFGTPADNTRGWLWNATTLSSSTDFVGLGWTSLSCFNDFDNDGQLEYQCPAVNPYGVTISDGGDGLGGSADYVQGCAWSAAYGWMCFNAGSQCSSGGACADLSANGVRVKSSAGLGNKMGLCSLTRTTSCDQVSDCPLGEVACIPSFYYVDTPAYAAGTWGAPAAAQYSTVVSLWDSGNKPKGYVSYPFTASAGTPIPSGTLYGCFNCDATSKTCGACLNVSTEVADATTNPNPNILCWNCGTCTVADTGSCNTNRDKNTCVASSCAGCTEYPGVVVNQTPASEYEMCGWGYHSYDDSAAAGVDFSLIDYSGSAYNGRYSDMVVDSTGLPAISYISKTGGSGGDEQVSVARCGDPACIIKKTLVINEEKVSPLFQEVVEAQTSIALEGQIPVIAYAGCLSGGGSSCGSKNLILARCVDENCNAVTQTVVTAGAGQIQNVSMAIGSDGYPVISFYDSGVNKLKIAKCASTDCATGVTLVYTHPTATTGQTNAITVLADTHLPVVAYSNGSDLYLLKCNDASCLTVTDTKLVTPSSAPAGIAIAVNPKGLAVDTPTIVYYDSGASGLKLIDCNDAACATSSNTPIAGNIGFSSSAPSILVDSNNYPVVSYIDTTNTKLHLIQCTNAACTTKTDTPFTTTGEQPLYETSVALGIDGFPVISYYNNASGGATGGKDFHYLKCHTAGCIVPTTGFGWIAVNPAHVGDITYINSSGNVLSGANVYSPVGPPTGKYNSVYIIEANGDITNWYSTNLYKYQQSSGLPTYLQPGVNQTGVYANVLGRLDVEGLTTEAITGVPTNKYGASIVPVSSQNDIYAAQSVDTVYHSAGPLTIDASGAFNVVLGKPGARIIVIDGDLTIGPDPGNPTLAITYDMTAPTQLREIPSVVWIVKGDMIIDPSVTALLGSVTALAGTFVVLGQGGGAGVPSKCPALSQASNSCGRFSTGSDKTKEKQLTITGSVLARQFNFGRGYSASQKPAEEFISDGRLQANPPPGLTDFAKSVPRFTRNF